LAFALAGEHDLTLELRNRCEHRQHELPAVVVSTRGAPLAQSQCKSRMLLTLAVDPFCGRFSKAHSWLLEGSDRSQPSFFVDAG
jgi:hypothetical protein